ncbi:MAG TPA: peroxiredoxin-like family protein [Gemmatimonadaceae bacterium]|nr:peroxiredoxin-like family protein [Gemmatimonadaceae bacterium]
MTETRLRPLQPAPPLAVPTVGRGLWRLDAAKPERFTMIVFYRGLHCPVCKSYLRLLDTRVDDFGARGVDVVAVSGDDEARAVRTVKEWDLKHVTVGYGQSIASMREWGLYVSNGIKPDEPVQFGEPGLFLIRPDGTLYYIAVTSMPFGRPSIPDMLGAIDFIIAHDYPARGEA